MSDTKKEFGLPTRMVLASFAGMGAAIFCHPLDVVRIQMQIEKGHGVGPITAARHVVEKGGVRGMYSGLTAAFVRQWTYGSCRMGIYSWLLNKNRDSNPSFMTKLGYGSISGGIGAFAGTPSELALVRMAADMKSPPEHRRGYKNVFDCFVKIAKEEGVTQLWRGAGLTIARAMSLSSFALGVTSESKVKLHEWGVVKNKEGIPCLFLSTVVASFFANGASMPFDVIKSRMQNMPIVKGVPLYSNALDCVAKSYAEGGIVVFWRGFTPAFIKLAPYTTLSLIFLDKMTSFLTGKSAL